jgi:hypothetical protein
VTALLALAAVYAAMMLVRYGRRGILAVAPSLVGSRVVEPAPAPTDAQRAWAGGLEALGFRRIGGRVEEGPLGGLGLRSETWADSAHATFADVFEQGPRPGAPARFQLLTIFPDGAAALTANHGRRARAGAGGEVQGLPGASLEAVAAVHRAAVARLAAAHGAPAPAGDLAGREAAARAWYRGEGGAEMRGRFAVYLANALVAAGILAFCLWAIYRSYVPR